MAGEGCITFARLLSSYNTPATFFCLSGGFIEEALRTGMSQETNPRKLIDDFFAILAYRTAQSLLSKSVSDLPGGEMEERLGQILEVVADELTAEAGAGFTVDLGSIAQQLTPERLREYAVAQYSNPDTCLMLMATTMSPDDFVDWIDDLGLEQAVKEFGEQASQKLSAEPMSRWIQLLEAMSSTAVDVNAGAVREVMTSRTVLDPIVLDKEAETAGRVFAQPETFASLLTQPNEAIVTFRERRNGWGGDMEKAIQMIWDSGFRAGGPKEAWGDLARAAEPTADIPKRTKSFQDTVFRVIEVLDEVTEKYDLEDLLEKGADRTLISLLNSASFNDVKDDIRRSKAQKRGGGEPDEPLEDIGIADNSIQLLFTEAELFADFDSMVGGAGLSQREKEAVLIRLAGVRDGGNAMTFSELADEMGVSVPTAKTLWRRAVEKLKPDRL